MSFVGGFWEWLRLEWEYHRGVRAIRRELDGAVLEVRRLILEGSVGGDRLVAGVGDGGEAMSVVGEMGDFREHPHNRLRHAIVLLERIAPWEMSSDRVDPVLMALDEVRHALRDLTGDEVSFDRPAFVN
jgi:hypothetical protein